MSYTMKNSINDIVNDEKIGRIVRILVAPFVFQAVPEEKQALPLEVLAAEMTGPNGMAFPADSILVAAEKAESLVANSFKVVTLWKDSPEGFIPDIRENSKDSVFLGLISESCPGEKKPAVIVVPGGGYHFVAHRGEGFITAEFLEKNGYKTFILNYRVGAENHWPAPQLDLALAFKYVKLHAAEYGIDPENITIIGSSAGGHLCGSFAALHESIEEMLGNELAEKHPDLAETYKDVKGIRPDQVCLVYPVITFTEGETHRGSYENLTNCTEELRAALSIENLVTPAYPKTYVWCCEDDPLVPKINTEKMDAALEKAGVPHIMRIFPTGGHGINLGIGTSAEGWADEMVEFFKK